MTGGPPDPTAAPACAVCGNPRTGEVGPGRCAECLRFDRRDLRDIDPVLAKWLGWRVEVTRYGQRERFIVHRSTGWRPVLLAVKTRRSHGGYAIPPGTVTDITPLYNVCGLVYSRSAFAREPDYYISGTDR